MRVFVIKGMRIGGESDGEIFIKEMCINPQTAKIICKQLNDDNPCKTMFTAFGIVGYWTEEMEIEWKSLPYPSVNTDQFCIGKINCGDK